MNLIPNDEYIKSLISLEEILRKGWIDGYDAGDVANEAKTMGYDINKEYVVQKWKSWEAESEYFGI